MTNPNSLFQLAEKLKEVTANWTVNPDYISTRQELVEAIIAVRYAIEELKSHSLGEVQKFTYTRAIDREREKHSYVSRSGELIFIPKVPKQASEGE